MQNLDDISSYAQIDTLGMLAQIDDLPGQLERAWKLGLSHPLPEFQGLRHVLVAGMGGSAIGADLLASYVQPVCRAPVTVNREYDLPAWAAGPETLVIASSHSGNTEETISAFGQARSRGCSLMVVATGGKLAEAARELTVPWWSFEHHGQPRAAVGYSFGLLLAALVRLGLIPDQEKALQGAVLAMRSQQDSLKAATPTVHNPAKRMAGQLMGRWVTVIGSGVLAPVARRWKGQISEIGKAWAQFEFLPEADHNTLAGIVFPEEQLSHMIALFLTAPSDHPRNQLRANLTRQSFMVEGINTDMIRAQGETPLEHLWTTLHFGDYMAYYLAMAYGIDPTPIPTIENLKRSLG